MKFPNQYSIECFSLAVYVQKGNVKTDLDEVLQSLTYAIKDGRSIRLKSGELCDPCDFIARNVELARCRVLGFGENILVPVPRSTETPRPPTPDSWPGLRLANALVAQDLGKAVLVALLRKTQIQKASSKTKLAERPSVEEHAASLVFDGALRDLGDTVTLVDDVMTSGTQMAGAMIALRRSGYQGEINAFTAFRSMGLNDDSSASHLPSRVDWFDGTSHARRYDLAPVPARSAGAKG